VSHPSAPELLVLHAVRLAGMADDAAAARRFGLDRASTHETLLDQQAVGWVTWSRFAETGGWSLTAAGRVEDERALAAELDVVDGARDVVRRAYAGFLPLNDRLQRACTDWQLRPAPGDALAENDHRDLAWDGRVLAELVAIGTALRPLATRLAHVLDRLGGYDARFATALGRVAAGDSTAVNRIGADSCHGVWMELHEDLIATLGISRGA
jgi:hypothetical protein